MQICLLTKKIGNWHIYGQAYHFMLRTAMVFLNTSGKDWQLAAIPKTLFIFCQMVDYLILNKVEIFFLVCPFQNKISFLAQRNAATVVIF